MKKAGSTERLKFMGLYCSVFCQFLCLNRKLGFSLTLWEASQICFLLGVSFKRLEVVIAKNSFSQVLLIGFCVSCKWDFTCNFPSPFLERGWSKNI